MREYVALLSIPNLRGGDLRLMPNLQALVGGGDAAPLVPSVPAITCPVQVSMTTGLPPAGHGVVANGFYDRATGELEMWTSPNSRIGVPQIWDRLHEQDASISSAVWFALLSKHAGADHVCLPAPIHNPDGTETMWCYTKPAEYYQELLDEFGQFPLHHFWGPLASIPATAWIVDSAIHAARKFRPNFFYAYLPHLDYAAQKFGPDSPQAEAAVRELDEQIGKLAAGFSAAYAPAKPLWLVASEYVIRPVQHVVYPNRVLRSAGLLSIDTSDDCEMIQYGESSAWAWADHQVANIFVKDRDQAIINRVVDLFRKEPHVAEVLTQSELASYDLAHPAGGDIVLLASDDSWFAYYWWQDDAQAPQFARTVDIHRKPGYDPVELHFDPATKSIPLDATLVRGSHGAPPVDEGQRGVLLSSQRGVFVEQPLPDTDIADIVLRQFGI